MPIDTTHLDEGSDKINLARPALLAAVQAINAMQQTGSVSPGPATTSGLTANGAKILGRYASSSGPLQEIAIGSGLLMSGGVLSALGGGGGGGIGGSSALVSWIRSAVGAVATTLENWLGWQSVNVFEFMTDDQIADVQARTALIDVTLAVQAAITAGAGKTVIFPPGKYLITSTLFMLAGTTLQGSPSGFGLQTVFVTPTNIITLTATSAAPGTGAPIYGLTVRDIRFENTTPVAAGLGMTTYHLKFVEATFARIENCTFVSLLSDADYHINNAGGIWLTGGSQVWLNHIHKCGVQGRILMDCTDSIISECHVFAQNGDYGIKLNGGNVTVSNCYDMNGGRGHGSVWLNAVAGCKISGCFFDIYGSGIYANNGSTNTIVGNTFIGTKGAPIILVDPLGFTVSGNTFTNCGTNDLVGLSSDIIIQGISYAPQGNSFIGNSHRKTDARTNVSYAVVEQNLGYAPILNVYVGNNISAGSYSSPGIVRVTTAGLNSSKLIGNIGAGVNTEESADYTPAWTAAGTAPSLGNGTLVGHYTRQGDVVTVQLKLTSGSTTTFGTNNWAFSLPFANGGKETVGQAVAVDSSTATIRTGLCISSASSPTINLLSHDNNIGAAGWSSSSPFAWSANDTLTLTITYSLT